MQTKPGAKTEKKENLNIAADSGSAPTNLNLAGRSVGRIPLLRTLVLVGGAAEMAEEMCASRIIQPFFGDSLLIWANLIGLIMIFLTLGYYIGGKLADRRPHPAFLYQLVALAAVLMAILPTVSTPILTWASIGSDKVQGGLFLGSLAGILALFSLPLILLGCIAPFAVRLQVLERNRAGKTAGNVSSLATVGGIIGTFVPVLYLIPTYGVHFTLYLFAAILLVFAAFGWWRVRGQDFSFTAENVQTEMPEVTALVANVKVNPVSLYAVVFTGGLGVMAVEMCASHLIQPYFGDSLLIWANLIGFIMIFLSVGYFVGGKLADRYPSPTFLYQLTAIAAFTIGLIPVLSDPVLGLAKIGFDQVNGGLFYGSLVGISLLFCIPLIMLGCVMPFAVRLQMLSLRNAGKTAGNVSSISTIGSILGTFLPVLVFIPTFSTRTSLYLLAVTLLAISLLALWQAQNLRLNVQLGINAALLVVVVALAFGLVINVIKPSDKGTTLIYEKESAINYIQVEKGGDSTYLVLNEGHAIHSIYNPNQILTGGYWDYYMLAPFFAKNVQQSQVKNALMVGLAAGTVPHILTAAYGDSLHVDGVEIDQEIVNVGNQYFHMGDQKNLTPIVQDGRYYLVTTDKKYDLIGIDAFHQPYIPFYLTTQEFFQQVHDHLNPNGVTAINVGSPAAPDGGRDYRLVNAIASTMRTVFPSVYIVDVPGTFNSVVIATNQPSTLDTFKKNLQSGAATSQLIQQVGQNLIINGNLRTWNQTSDIFTDDHAPVEQLIDQIILDYVGAGGK